jgi:hypothetical protein
MGETGWIVDEAAAGEARSADEAVERLSDTD